METRGVLFCARIINELLSIAPGVIMCIILISLYKKCAENAISISV
jgi:hypothetical protein